MQLDSWLPTPSSRFAVARSADEHCILGYDRTRILLRSTACVGPVASWLGSRACSAARTSPSRSDAIAADLDLADRPDSARRRSQWRASGWPYLAQPCGAITLHRRNARGVAHRFE